MNSNEDESDAEDLTLAAGDDVIAQIRALADKVRRDGEAAAEQVEVATPPVAQPEADDGDVTCDVDVTEAEDLTVPNAGPVVSEQPEEADPAAATPAAAVVAASGKRFVSLGDQPLLPNDDTVAFEADSSIIDLTEDVERERLIDELAPPKSPADFWGPTRRFGASGMDRKPVRGEVSSVPFWVWVVLVILIIAAISIGVVLAVATMMPRL